MSPESPVYPGSLGFPWILCNQDGDVYYHIIVLDQVLGILWHLSCDRTEDR